MDRNKTVTELDRLREQLDDPTLSLEGLSGTADLDTYAHVHELTRVLVPALVPSASTLDVSDVIGGAGARRRRIVAVRAAVAVLAFALCFMLRDGAHTPKAEAAVVLQSIPLEIDARAASLPDLPQALATYEPVIDGAIQWVDDLEQARAIARASERPLLVVGVLADCTECERVLASFAQPRVHALLEHMVPARVDMQEQPERVALLREADAWPYVSLERSRGATLGVLAGGIDVRRLPLQLEALLAVVEGPRLPWPRIQTIAKAVASARSAVHDERIGQAYTTYRTLLDDGGERLARQAAQEGLRALEARASQTLLRIRTLAGEEGARAATRALRAQLGRFEGTPFHGDLQRVLEHIDAFGRFPELRPPPLD